LLGRGDAAAEHGQVPRLTLKASFREDFSYTNALLLRWSPMDDI
jgi:hypothetical protein